MTDSLAGRSYPRVYRVSGRGDLRDFLVGAVRSSGGEVLFVSDANRAPVYLGVQGPNDERIGILCYPFRCNPPPITNRPPDEHRLQVRYGGEANWGEEHPVGRDVAGVDTTIVLGVHLDAEVFIGLEPDRYDPLPMGISVEFKQADVDQVTATGWHMWERERRPGRRRGETRALAGLETLIGFHPERLLSYVSFERRATGLGLDSPLRFRAAQAASAISDPNDATTLHRLEEEFGLASRDILEIIATRARLSTAVRGGVAEHHLLKKLQESAEVAQATPLDRDAQPDIDATLADGRRVLIECKNVSPNLYANGDARVEVQKTRSQKDDPAGRFYRPGQFDVVAACMFAVTQRWEFKYKATATMDRHPLFPDRLGVLHRVDDSWSDDLAGALEAM